MENLPDQINQLKNLLQEYLDTNLEYYKIAGFEKLMRLIVALVFTFVLLAVGLVALIFVGLALAIWLGKLLEDVVLGHMIMASFFVLLLLLVYLLRKPLVERPLIKTFAFFLLQQGKDGK